MDDLALRERAEKRVEAKASLRSHWFTYIVVNAFLFAIDWWSGGGIDWAYWAAIGWGVGIALHTLSTFAELGGDRERAVEREMERLRRRST